jgi:serine/threonine protein kinase/WD40 repeat protein
MPAETNTAKTVFLAALDKATPAERASYLDKACAEDGTLRQRVEALLQAHDQPDEFLDQPASRHFGDEEARTLLDFLEPIDKEGVLGRLGHYEVLEVVGQGGMGIVLRALDEKLHRVVAIKVLAPLLACNGAARQRFVREAQAAAAVMHDHVIGIHAVEDAGPVPYLVMQFIDGHTLQEKIDRSGPLPLTEVLRIGLQIAEGLAAAHKQGLIHRDIKPANILLENGIERVKITDFGLARTVDDASLTQSGIIAGTPAYMSPEQGNDEPIDHRSDLFSLGSVLYTMCAGHPPFRAGNAMATLKRVCEDIPRPLHEINPAIPAWLEALIAKLHAKDPADRFATATEVATLLSTCLAQLQTGATVSVPVHSPGVHHASRPVVRWIALGLLLVVVVGGGWLIRTQWFASRQGTDGGNEEVRPNSNPIPTPTQPIVLKPSHTLRKHTGALRSLAFSPDGKVLASGGADRCIFLWDTTTWEARGPLQGHTGEVASLAFSPDGSTLASVTNDNDTCLIRLWDVAEASPAETLGDAGYGMWAVAFSPDGKTLACGGWDRALHLLDVATGTEQRVIPEVASFLVRTLSYSPDGKMIATGGKGPARLWDPATGQEIQTNVTLPQDMGPTFLPDGNGLAGWTYGQGRVTLCDLPSGKVRATWRAHPQTIEWLAVSGDGRFLASVGSKGVVRIWSTADQKEVATLLGHQGIIHAAAFTPDGAQLVSAGHDDLTLRVWDLPAMCRVSRE